MRLWHILFAVFLCAATLAIARDEAGRVALVVFVLAMGEVVLGLAAILMLFRTLGALGEARSATMCVEALAATAAVLLVGTATMTGMLWVGVFLLQAVIR